MYQIETYEIILLALWSPQHQIYIQKTYEITYNFKVTKNHIILVSTFLNQSLSKDAML
jgi:hypothetical protein